MCNTRKRMVKVLWSWPALLGPLTVDSRGDDFLNRVKNYFFVYECFITFTKIRNVLSILLKFVWYKFSFLCYIRFDSLLSILLKRVITEYYHFQLIRLLFNCRMWVFLIFTSTWIISFETMAPLSMSKFNGYKFSWKSPGGPPLLPQL